jgi:acetylornithine deacetylase/succinyl-diaminopimelate desuccinylase-like protein
MVSPAAHPIVLAEWHRMSGAPTLVIYGHYDVQPPGTIRDWRTPPFEPVRMADRLHGRGASDDKGPVAAHLLALESWLRGAGRLPLNVRCVFDGEEEVGSPGIGRLLRQDPARLGGDAAVVSDTRIPSPDRPAITYALRGSIGMEIQVQGGPSDLHSGVFGGAVADPLQALCQIVASLHDARGRVMVPGFRAGARAIPPSERAFMARNGPTDARLVAAANGAAVAGDPGASLYERTTTHPALTVTGVHGGHAGHGAGALIPHRARATLDVRLVPDQDPRRVAAAIRDHALRSVPAGLRAQITLHRASRPVLIDRSHPVVRAAARSCRLGFGREPLLLRSGGTIPVVELFVHRLGLPVALIGMALPDDGMHAPNERAHLPTLHRGVETIIWFLHEMDQLGGGVRPDTAATAARHSVRVRAR